MSVDDNSILNLTNLGTHLDGEVITAPGTPDNPWIGFDTTIRGHKTFHALSGSERRRLRRKADRDAVNERERGQRAYNRDQRKREFDADTVRQQLAILKGDIPVTPAMMDNLVGHIQRQTKLADRDLEAERDRKIARADARLATRQLERVEAGTARHSDLVAMGIRGA